MRRIGRMVIATALSGAAACGSSKSTAPAASASTAFHFDSLYNSALALRHHGDSSRAAAVALVSLVLGAGATPTPVTINAGGTATAFHAAAVELVFPNLSLVPIDSEFLVVAWNNSSADEMVLSEQDANNVGLSANLVLSDTIIVVPDSGAAVDTVAGTAPGRCSITDVAAAESVLNSFHTSLTTAPCTMSMVRASFAWHFTPLLSPAKEYVLSTQSFVTPRLVMPPH